jgi:hypothetical protein
MNASARKTVLRVLCAFGMVAGIWLAIRGFLRWQHAGFPTGGALSPKNDGSMLGFFIGLLITFVSWFTLANSFRSDDHNSN